MKRVPYLIAQKSFQSLKLGRFPVHSIGTRTYVVPQNSTVLTRENLESEYKVTLLAFSGRPDLDFSVSSSHARFNDVKKDLEQAKRKPDLTRAVASKLGYKGFLVKENDQHHHIAHREAAPFQRLLLEIGAQSNKISPELRDLVLKSIETDELGTFAAKASAAPSVMGIAQNPGPRLNLGRWNNDDRVRRKNNCYNYGTDTMTCTFAQPGRGTGHMYPAIQPNLVLDAAISDGLKLVDPHPFPAEEPMPVPSEEQWLVALVVSTTPESEEDFHWYRLDNNGYWSHKPGRTAATTVDGKGNAITDPREAAMFPYKFVAFMYSKPTSPID